MQDFKRLDVWRKAHELTLEIYQVTRRFPDDERFGLVSQMRRCAVSIPSNIAEGTGRSTPRDFLRFLDISLGSALELEYQLLLCRDLGFLIEDSHTLMNHSADEVQKMLVGLQQSVKKRL